MEKEKHYYIRGNKKHPATLDYHGACVAELFIKAITNEE